MKKFIKINPDDFKDLRYEVNVSVGDQIRDIEVCDCFWCTEITPS